MSRKQWIVAAIVLVTGVTASVPVAAQFRKGILKSTTEVTLNSKRAPKVYLSGTAIRVDAVAQNPALADVAGQLGSLLEAELTSHDSRLTPVRERPETTITVTLLQLDSNRANVTRKEMVSKQTGTNKEGKAVYGLVEENRTYLVVTGRLNATLQVRDVGSSGILDSDTPETAYSQDFLNGVGAPQPSEVSHALVQRLVNAIVPRLTPTIQPIKVLLARPNDEIDDLNDFGKKNEWPLMLEKLTLVKPLSDPKKEAYRLYNLGVVNEALAYATNDLGQSQSLLREASRYYSDARTRNDAEDYFVAPQKRIGDALANYSTLEAMQAKSKEAALTAASKVGARDLAVGTTPAAAPGGAANAASSTFTNASVIELMKQGLDGPLAIEIIKGAESVNFDLGPAGLSALLTGKVPNTVIAAMRARQAAGAAPAPAVGRRGGTAAAPGTTTRPAAPRGAAPPQAAPAGRGAAPQAAPTGRGAAPPSGK